jgi:hypothetical protein
MRVLLNIVADGHPGGLKTVRAAGPEAGALRMKTVGGSSSGPQEGPAQNTVPSFDVIQNVLLTSE